MPRKVKNWTNAELRAGWERNKLPDTYDPASGKDPGVGSDSLNIIRDEGWQRIGDEGRARVDRATTHYLNRRQMENSLNSVNLPNIDPDNPESIAASNDAKSKFAAQSWHTMKDRIDKTMFNHQAFVDEHWRDKHTRQ